MKKISLKAAALSLMLMSGVSANAQIDLGNIVGGVLGSGSTGDIVSNLTSVFSGDKQASAENLAGTWVYTEPAVVFQSDNFLTNTAAKVAAKQVEKKLQTQLNKVGIKPGAMSLTLKSDGTFTETIGSKTISGKWTVQDKKLQMTYGGVKTIALTTQLSGKTLQFVTDATKLLELFKTVGNASGNANLKTITSLMNKVTGMQAGLTLTKQ